MIFGLIVSLMLGQCRRNYIEPTMVERLVPVIIPMNAKHLYNIYTTSAQRLRRLKNIV